MSGALAPVEAPLHPSPDGRWGTPRRSSPSLRLVMSPTPKRLSRLAEELEECGLPPEEGPERELLLEEVDKALRPRAFEGRVPTSGTIINPRGTQAEWEAATGLAITRLQASSLGTDNLRRFVDGLSSWLCVGPQGKASSVLLFDRPAGSERDVVVLAKAFGATLVQRHPAGVVRVVGPFGALRWEGLEWRLERPVKVWLKAFDREHLGAYPAVAPLLEFAVHDLASAGIGAVLITRPDAEPGPAFQERLAVPPELKIGTPMHLAPLRHALAFVDGAAIFDQGGTLRHLGVILYPSTESHRNVPVLGGTRHTSAARYSYDDPFAIVVVVSEDGPVTVLRDGEVRASSR